MEEFSFGLFDDLLEGALHPLQIDDYEDEQDDLPRKSTKPSLVDKLRSMEACIYTPVGGDTKLHHAIRCSRQAGINALLELYQEDFDKVRDHLVSKYHWNPADKVWSKKTILVAKTEEQCHTTKSFERDQINRDDVRRAVFVLLKCPVDGEEVAILHPDNSNRLSAVQLIKTLIPNGFLSWNYVGYQGKCETFMQSAVSKGMHEVIDRLYELGAPIAIPGHNPLLTAIKSNRKETVKWLLAEHFDHFDCTLRDRAGTNALIAAMQKNHDGELFDLVLEKMIAYRQKYFNETDEEAFQEIFRVEQDEFSCTTILNYLQKSGPIFERVENAIQKYKLKLSHRWMVSSVVLGSLIRHKTALDYCFEGIRKDPQLLGLNEHESATILHKLVRLGHIDFVREMYTKHPDVKDLLSDSVFDMVQIAINNQSCETIRFMLEHHGELLKSDLDKLRDEVVCCQYYTNEFYELRRDMLVECFPELRESIEEMRTRTPSNNYDYGIEESFAQVNIDVSDFDKLPKPYSTARGSNGETLLHLAVDKDDKELLARILEDGCEFDALDNDGNHPVHLVKSEEMLDLIINRHPEGRNIIQRTNNDGCTILHKVCQQKIDSQKCVALLEKLIEYGADVHQLTKHGESAVFFAGDHQVLDLLRSHGVQLDSVNDLGETPLERHLCNVWMARPLFSYVHDLPSFKQHAHKYLAPILNQCEHVYSYDYQVVFEECPEAARLMIDSVYEHSREEASRLFCKACTTGFVHVVKLFLDGDYDLDFNYKDEYGGTPLLGVINIMVQSEAVHIFKRLLEKIVVVQNNVGREALMILIWRYQDINRNGFGRETVQLLLDQGVSINATDEAGNTPLHLAFQQSEFELVEFLIKHGANSSAVNSHGKRPFEMASMLDQELFYFYRDEFMLK